MARGARLAAVVLLALASPAEGSAQVLAEPVMNGRAQVGDAALPVGVVVLHHVTDSSQGEIDSTRVGPDGSFTLRLPSVPNPAAGDLYFASVEHDGVMYFGGAVTSAIQLDSVYLIQVYDTLLAPAEGVAVVLQARNVFLEASGSEWQVTDVFQLRNDRDRTVVARPGGHVWSYPLPDVARGVITGEGELSTDVATYEGGQLVVRAALPPGERLFVVRYLIDSPELSIPTPGETEAFDLLVREPAPPLEVDAMQQTESIEIDAGETFRRYAAENLSAPFIRVALGESSEPPQVQWIAVILALVLATGGLLALRSTGRAAAAPGPQGRQSILVQIARLDEEFHGSSSPSRSATREYRRRRAELMRLLQTRE